MLVFITGDCRSQLSAFLQAYEEYLDRFHPSSKIGGKYCFFFVDIFIAKNFQKFMLSLQNTINVDNNKVDDLNAALTSTITQLLKSGFITTVFLLLYDEIILLENRNL